MKGIILVVHCLKHSFEHSSFSFFFLVLVSHAQYNKENLTPDFQGQGYFAGTCIFLTDLHRTRDVESPVRTMT